MSPGSVPPLDGGGQSANDPVHDRFPDLAAYVMGALPLDEAAAFEAHLRDCDECRAERPALEDGLGALAGVPVELFFDGPPDDAQLLVRRTLRQLSAVEDQMKDDARPAPARSGSRRWATVPVVAAAVLVLALGGVVGGVIGRSTAPAPVALPGPWASTAPSSGVPVRTASATDPVSGARLAVRVLPAAGWVRISAATAGIRQGERCHLLVVAYDGRTVEAGSWVVGPKAAESGLSIDGSALVAPDDVASVRVQDDFGRVLVQAEI